MESDRNTGAIVGVLFIIATVASILGSVALGSVLDGPDYLTGVSAHENQLVLAVLLFLIAASAAVATAFVLFPILRRHAEGLAAGYVVLRTFENVLYVAGVVALLIMLTVSQTDAIDTAGAPDVRLLGGVVLALHDWSVQIGTLIFAGMASTMLNYVLYRSGLVPRWLSLWGLIGAPLVFAYGLTGIFGQGVGFDSPLFLLAMPLAVQEMVFAVWLITVGFNKSAPQPDQTVARRLAVTA
jgi:hypothetical protein